MSRIIDLIKSVSFLECKDPHYVLMRDLSLPKDLTKIVIGYCNMDADLLTLIKARDVRAVKCWLNRWRTFDNPLLSTNLPLRAFKLACRLDQLAIARLVSEKMPAELIRQYLAQIHTRLLVVGAGPGLIGEFPELKINDYPRMEIDNISITITDEFSQHIIYRDDITMCQVIFPVDAFGACHLDFGGDDLICTIPLNDHKLKTLFVAYIRGIFFADHKVFEY